MSRTGSLEIRANSNKVKYNNNVNKTIDVRNNCLSARSVVPSTLSSGAQILNHHWFGTLPL